MGININGLANAMKLATYGIENVETALTNLGNGIATYLINNAELNFSWHGEKVNPIPPPPTLVDPVVIANGGIVSLTIHLTASHATSVQTALDQLANEIRAGVMAGTYNITDAGFSTIPLPMSDIPLLSLNPSNASGENGRNDAFAFLANEIITWFTGYTPAAPVLGSHGDFTAPTGTGGTPSGPFS